MSFASRSVVVLAILETTAGTYSAPSGTNAMLIGSNYSFSERIGKVDRDNLRPWMGGADQLNAFRYVEVEFTVELASSGTAGTAPKWGPLMRAAGFAETIVASTLVHYTPISEAFEALSMSIFYGGVRQNLRGCRVRRVVFDLTVNQIPRATFTIVGVPRLSPDDLPVLASPATPTFSGWQVPHAVLNELGTSNVYLGRTYNVSTGNLSGGTNYSTKGMVITVDNDCTARPFLGWGGDHTPIVDRTVRAQVTFDHAAQERIDFLTAAIANTYNSLDLVHAGPVAGQNLKFFMPRVGYQDPTNEDDGGLFLTNYNFNALPNAGNDDIYITAM